MFHYKAAFDDIESTLIRIGKQRVSEAVIRQQLDDFKHFEDRTLTDDEYYRKMVAVIFYSGMNAQTVNDRLDAIYSHFPDYQTVGNYGSREENDIANDPSAIAHQAKIRACINNARVFKTVIATFGSFRCYVDSFSPSTSPQNLQAFRNELRARFAFLGRITAYHFMTDIGLPVLKPDRVLRRIFFRLGVVNSADESEQTLQAVIHHGRMFAEATGYPIRYVDRVMVAYGQMSTEDLGISTGICLDKNPACDICGVTAYCRYYIERQAQR